MSITDKHIVDSYSSLLENLSFDVKVELMEKLAKSLLKEDNDIQNRFFESFGAFASEKPAEEIISEIKSNRNFSAKNIEFLKA